MNDLVERAKAGDRSALEQIVRAVQDDVFHLSLRMLGHPDDARAAAQEILVRIVTRLGSFRGDSRFETWVHRVAINALLNYRPTLRRREQSFDDLGEQLDAALAHGAGQPTRTDTAVLNEAKLVCTQGMLLCLDRPHRLAFILGEVVGLSSEEGAAMLEISSAAFRQRLARARADMDAFLAGHCGLANPMNPCRCAKLLPAATAGGLIDPERPQFEALPVRRADRLLSRSKPCAQPRRSSVACRSTGRARTSPRSSARSSKRRNPADVRRRPGRDRDRSPTRRRCQLRWTTRVAPHAGGARITQDLEYRVKSGPVGWVFDRLVMERKLRSTIDEVFERLVEHAAGGTARG